jgi:hypothetical protein
MRRAFSGSPEFAVGLAWVAVVFLFKRAFKALA